MPTPVIIGATEGATPSVVMTTSLSATRPLYQVANYTIPTDASALTFGLTVSSASAQNFLRVTFSTVDGVKTLGAIDLSATTTATTHTLPLTTQLRGVSGTLAFQVVTGTTTLGAVATVQFDDDSRKSTLGDLGGTRQAALEEAVNGFDAFFGNLSKLPSLTSDLPIKLGTKSMRVIDMIDPGFRLRSLITDRTRAYFASATRPNTSDLVAFLRSQTIAGTTTSLSGITAVSDDEQVVIRVPVSLKKPVTGLRPDLTAGGDATGLKLASAVTVAATAAVTADLAIGFKIENGVVGVPFARVDQFAVNVTSSGAISFSSLLERAHVGVLAVGISGGTFSFEAIVATPSAAGHAHLGRDIPVTQLVGLSPFELLTPTAAGPLTINLPVNATLGDKSFSATLAVSDANVFDNAAPTVSAPGFSGITNFTTLSRDDVLGVFGRVRAWMNDLAGSSLMGPTVVGAGNNTKLGTAVDLGRAFAEQVIAKIFDATNKVPTFTSLQQMLTQLGSSTGAKFDTATSTLTFPVVFSGVLPALTDVPISLDLPGLSGVSSSAKVTLTPSISGRFTLGIDFRPLGHNVTVGAATTLAALNGQKGIAPSGDPLTFAIGLTDGTSVAVSLSGAATLGDVVNRINAATGAAGKLVASIDTTGKRLVLTDKASGVAPFSVTPTNGSFAAVGLGIAGVDAAASGADHVIVGKPLHGDDIPNHVFIAADSTATPANVAGTLNVAATNVSATATLGFVGVGITGGTLTSSAGFTLPLKDSGNLDGRLTLPELLTAIPDAAASATPAFAKAKLVLPVAVQPAGLFPTTGAPTVTIDWVDNALFTEEGVDANGVPLPTNAVTTVTYNAAAQSLKNYAALTTDAVINGLGGLSRYFTSGTGLKTLAAKLPMMDVGLGDLLGLASTFDQLVKSLRATAPATLAQLQSQLQASFGVPGAVVTLSLDTTNAAAPALKVRFAFKKTVTAAQALNVPLNSGTLVDVQGSSKLTTTATVDAVVDFGLDLSTPATPKPFLYDTTKFTLTAIASATAIQFGASVGALGVFIKDNGTTKAEAVFDADGQGPSAAPASYSIAMKPAANGRYFFTDDIIANTVDTLLGKAQATLPVFAPTAATPLSTPIRFAYDLATATTTLTTPFDSGVPTVDLTQTLDGFRQSFIEGIDKVKANLATALSKYDIPLIGAKLTESLKFLDQLRDSVLAKLPAAGTTLSFESVKTAISQALNSLGWVGSSLASSWGTPEEVQFSLKLKRAVTFTAGAVDFSTGLPGLGLSLSGTKLNLGTGFDMNLGFGMSRTHGFYLIADPSTDELKLDVSAESPIFNATGTLGLFKVQASNISGQALRAGATFNINLIDPSAGDNKVTTSDLTTAGVNNLISGGFGTDAAGRPSGVDLNLALRAGFTSASIPALTTGLHVKWLYGGSPAAAGLPSLSGNPNVTFDNVRVQMGEVLQRTILPVLQKVEQVLKPVDPIIKALTARIPVISDLMGRTVSLADLARMYGLSEITNYINAAAHVKTLVGLAAQSASNGIDLGGFSFSMSPNQKLSNTNLSLTQIFSPPAAPSAQATGSQTSFFTATAGNTGGLTFPILENPTTAFGLLLGKDVDLIKFATPKLKVEFLYSQFFPIMGPLGAQLTGKLGAAAQFNFGLDTKAFNRKTPLLDGFYVDSRDSSGKLAPQVTLYGSITAGVELNLLIAKAGIEGGIYGNVDFTLHDEDGDGKVRFQEITNSITNYGPLYVFDVKGALQAGLSAYVEIDLFFWSKRWDWAIARVTLLDFNLARGAAKNFNPGNVDATGRLNLATTSEADTYRILPGEAPGEVVVQTRGTLYTRKGVKTLTFYGGGGNDSFFIDPEVTLLPDGGVWLTGGVGDDVFTGGAMLTRIDGGDGNDQIAAGPGRLSAIGGTGNDVIIGSDLADTIDGGDGNDSIQGKGGADSIFGTGGDDFIMAGGGADTATGGAGVDQLYGEDGNDYLDAHDGGLDTVDGGAGDDRLLNGRVQSGGEGNDTLVTSATNATLTGGGGSDTITGSNSSADLIFGDESSPGVFDAGRDKISAGGGNDTIYGDGGADSLGRGDTIDAGAGNDLVYSGLAAPFPDVISTGNDSVIAGDGHDTVYGANGNDTIDGGSGNNLLYGAGGNDVISALDGRDVIEAGNGNDTVSGGLENDLIRGGRGNDAIHAGVDALPAGKTDNDTVSGDAGADTIGTGVGNDVIYGDAATNANDAGPGGEDAFGADKLFAGEGNDIVFGQGGDDDLNGNGGQDEIYGGVGKDLLYGGRDSDLLEGGDGTDTVAGGTGADILKLDIDPAYTTGGDALDGFGGNGRAMRQDRSVISDTGDNDSLQATDAMLVAGTDGDDNIRVFTNAATPLELSVTVNNVTRSTRWKKTVTAPLVRQVQVMGFGGNDTIDMAALDVAGLALTAAGQFPVLLYGGTGSDTLTGTNGGDQVFGDAGSDVVYGKGGNDELWGDALGGGDDFDDGNRIFGGAGNDDLIGGRGQNYLYAWSSDPAATGTKPFGVFTDGTNTTLEKTGLDRMLGGSSGDRFYGSAQPSFMYGNGGNDVVFDVTGQPRTIGEVDSSSWAEYSEDHSNVWYVQTSDGDDEVSVSNESSTGLVVTYQERNSGNVTRTTTYTASGSTVTEKVVTSQSTTIENHSTGTGLAKVTAVNDAALSAPGAFSRASTLSTTSQGWAGTEAGSATAQQVQVIMIRTLKGADKVTVGPTVKQSVWVDGGIGNDTLTIDSDGIIERDPLEGGQGQSNDAYVNASDLGTIGGSVRYKGLTIHTGVQPADVDWYRFTLGAPAASMVLSGLSINDGMIAEVFAASGPTTGVHATSANGTLDLNGLAVGQTYLLRVASNGKTYPATGVDQHVGIATIYDMTFTLDDGSGGQTVPVADYSTGRPFADSRNVLIGGDGNDSLTGGAGRDWIIGGSGDDVVTGGLDKQARDLIFGGAGNDKLKILPDDLPAGTNAASFVVGDAFDGGADTDVVEYAGQPIDATPTSPGTLDFPAGAGLVPDFVALGYVANHGLYQLTTKVWSGDATTGAWAMSNGVQMQRYAFLNLTSRTQAISVSLGEGADTFRADGSGYQMPDGASYGISATSGAPVGYVSVTGGNGSDTLVGSDLADSLKGGDANDTIFGNGGDDTIEGDAGDDSLSAGDGDDRTYGFNAAGITGDLTNGLGSNRIDGGLGRDQIWGENGIDYVTDTGAALAQIIITYGGNDQITLTGTTEADSTAAYANFVNAGPGGNKVWGGAGRDRIIGGELRDDFYGGGGNDTLEGLEGGDYLFGGVAINVPNSGNDSLLGGGGNDTLRGSDGSDTVKGEAGEDIVDGGGGNSGAPDDGGNDSLYGGTENDELIGQAGDDRLFGEDGDDTLRGEENGDWLYGGKGHDSLIGGSGNDHLYGSLDTADEDVSDKGRDTLSGGDGTDTIYGGAGADSIDGGTSNDTIYGGTGNDTILGGDGADLIRGGNDEIESTASNPDHDVIFGDYLVTYGTDWDVEISSAEMVELGNDTLRSGHVNFNDTISGRYGSDLIVGQGGRDSLSGGDGNDTVIGGWGADYMSGGDGRDSIWGGEHSSERPSNPVDSLYSNTSTDRTDGDRDEMWHSPNIDFKYYDSAEDSSENAY